MAWGQVDGALSVPMLSGELFSGGLMAVGLFHVSGSSAWLVSQHGYSQATPTATLLTYLCTSNWICRQETPVYSP